MEISKIPIPNNCYLVEIVTDENDKMNHSVYFLDNEGELIDQVIIRDAYALQVGALIHHMVIVHFTSDVIQEFDNINLVFSRLTDDIKESEYKPSYDELFSWQLTEETVNIIRMYAKLRHVHNYKDTTEYANEKHIASDFCYAHTDEQSYEDSLNLLNTLSKWVA